MVNDFINSYGVQTSVNKSGVLMSYSIDSKSTKEIYFKSLSSALNYFKVKSINDITGIDFLLT